MPMVVSPAYRLYNVKGRRYVFYPYGDGYVGVRRYENCRLVRYERMTEERARNRWKWLIKIGYQH